MRTMRTIPCSPHESDGIAFVLVHFISIREEDLVGFDVVSSVWGEVWFEGSVRNLLTISVYTVK